MSADYITRNRRILNACPFCGSRKLRCPDARTPGMKFVYCWDCGAMGAPRKTALGAVRAWNRRDIPKPEK